MSSVDGLVLPLQSTNPLFLGAFVLVPSVPCLPGKFHYLTQSFGLFSTEQLTGLKSDDVSLGIPPARPGQGYGRLGYLQDS